MHLHIAGIGPIALGVMVALFVMSVLSIAVAAERWWVFRQADRQSRRFAADAAALLRQGRISDVLAVGRGPAARHSHVAAIVGAGIEEWLDRRARGVDPELAAVATRDALRHATDMRLAEQKRGLALLATIGSTAPFVGLFGTTFGIIDAFAAIGATGSTAFGAVAAGISEALATTAFGLFVAIPAVWAYNYLLGRIEDMGVALERASYRLVDHLGKQG